MSTKSSHPAPKWAGVTLNPSQACLWNHACITSAMSAAVPIRQHPPTPGDLFIKLANGRLFATHPLPQPLTAALHFVRTQYVDRAGCVQRIAGQVAERVPRITFPDADAIGEEVHVALAEFGGLRIVVMLAPSAVGRFILIAPGSLMVADAADGHADAHPLLAHANRLLRTPGRSWEHTIMLLPALRCLEENRAPHREFTNKAAIRVRNVRAVKRNWAQSAFSLITPPGVRVS